MAEVPSDRRPRRGRRQSARRRRVEPLRYRREVRRRESLERVLDYLAEIEPFVSRAGRRDGVKIAVVGVGDGVRLRALLADAGNDVSVIDTSLDQVSAIRQRGLRVEGAVETESYDCTQRTTPARSAP